MSLFLEQGQLFTFFKGTAEILSPTFHTVGLRTQKWSRKSPFFANLIAGDEWQCILPSVPTLIAIPVIVPVSEHARLFNCSTSESKILNLTLKFHHDPESCLPFKRLLLTFKRHSLLLCFASHQSVEPVSITPLDFWLLMFLNPNLFFCLRSLAGLQPDCPMTSHLLFAPWVLDHGHILREICSS